MSNFEVKINWDVKTPLGDRSIDVSGVPRDVFEALWEALNDLQQNIDGVYITRDSRKDDPTDFSVIIKEPLSPTEEINIKRIVHLVARRAEAAISSESFLGEIPSAPTKKVTEDSSVMKLLRELPKSDVFEIKVPPSIEEQKFLYDFLSEFKDSAWKLGAFCFINHAGGTKKTPSTLFVSFPTDKVEIGRALLSRYQKIFDDAPAAKFHLEIYKKADGQTLELKLIRPS